MQELLQAAAAPVNIIFTILLVMAAMYWLSVMIGALDVGSLDFDMDFDTNVDVDVDADVDGDLHPSVSFLASSLQFFNFGRLPFMVIFSVLILFMWSVSVLTNHYWGQGSVGFALAMLFPNLFVSLIITKLLTGPLTLVFDNMEEGAAPIDYIGQICLLKLPVSTTETGQAEVRIDGNVLLINVRGDQLHPIALNKGEEALITGRSSDNKYFESR